ncbi:hypothetical protein ACHAWF_012634, partial [Thalassiosira exigua]
VVGGGDGDSSSSSSEEALSRHELAHALGRLLEAVLEAGRFLIVHCDDRQFAHKASIDMIADILMGLGQREDISRRCLFVGLYRSDEIDCDHPFAMQCSLLQRSNQINVTEIALSGLSKDGVVDMLMLSLKLPRRMVVELADVVFKKTSGHPLFVTQLLTSLVQQSIISYSLHKHCYTWDLDTVDFLPMGNDVATFIASNLSKLPPKALGVLQMLSTFGMQTDISLMQILEKFREGTISSVDMFVERGILDRAGGLIIFTHDLIQQTVYDGMTTYHRQSLHVEIGWYLGELSRTR